MRSGGSPTKGGRFEREVCRRLSLWVTNGESSDVFWRSATSGARATVQLKSGNVNRMQSGDISAVDPRGYPFVEANFVEIKHRKDLAIGRGFISRTGDLYNFWRRAEGEADKYDKRPLLIARQNLYPTLAITCVDAGIFVSDPMIELRHWPASVYLFDDATLVRPRLIRRTG